MIAYLIGFIYLGTKLLKETGFNQSLLKKIALLAIILHGSAAVNLLFTGQGLFKPFYNFSANRICY